MDRKILLPLFLAFIGFAGTLLCGYRVGYATAEVKYKKELEWWTHEPMVRVMDMNFTHTADLDIWKMNHADAKIIKLVELPQKQHYGVYWLPAEKEK